MADLIDYRKFKWQNQHFQYILVVIDAFSRYAWTRPLKTKSSFETAKALQSIFEDMNYSPRFFASDQGNEFTVRNKHLHDILIKKYRMNVYTLKGKTKSSIVERWNRTLKTRLQRYFTEMKTKRWTNVLQNFTKNINYSINRSTGFAPADINFGNVDQVRRKLYPHYVKYKPCKLKVGDVVRLVVDKQLFRKGYEQSKFRTFG